MYILFFMHLLEHLCIWRCWKQRWISWSKHDTLENRIEEGWKSPEELPNDGIDAVIPNVACAQSAKSCVCSCLLPLNWWYLWKTSKWSVIASIWACICPLPGANSYLSQWCWIPKTCFPTVSIQFWTRSWKYSWTMSVKLLTALTNPVFPGQAVISQQPNICFQWVVWYLASGILHMTMW